MTPEIRLFVHNICRELQARNFYCAPDYKKSAKTSYCVNLIREPDIWIEIIAKDLKNILHLYFKQNIIPINNYEMWAIYYALNFKDIEKFINEIESWEFKTDEIS